MKKYWFAIKAEIIKLKRSRFFLTHILVPLAGAVLFSFYLKNRNWDETMKLSTYLTAIAAAFPFMISIVTAMNIQIEEDNSFMWMLQAAERKTVLFSKLVVLNVMGCFSVAFAFFLGIAFGFASFFVPAWKLFLFLCMPNVILYAFHMMLSLQFGKSVSVFLGICGTIISMLFLTGLGDGIWKFVPGSMAARACNELILLGDPAYSDRAAIYKADLSGFFLICGIEIILMILLLALWFSHWEGRKVYE